MEDISHWAPGKASVVCWSTKYIHEKECLKVVKNTVQKIQVCLNFSRGEWGGGGGGGGGGGECFGCGASFWCPDVK